MTSLRARLLGGAILGTTIAFAVGGLVVHQLVRLRLAAETDTSLNRSLDFTVARLGYELYLRQQLRGDPIRPGDGILFNPTGSSDLLYLCRTVDGVLIDMSDELGEASAVIDLPEAELERAVFGDFVLADGAPARGAAVLFHADPSSFSGSPEGAGRQATPLTERPPMRLIVLQSVKSRDATLRHLALVLGSAWLLACAIGSCALWLTIRRGLRPLEDLRARIADLDWRSGSAPISIPGAPEELAPVVAQLEESRQRIVSAFRRERRFVGDAAHELRTPVSGIRAILEVALRRQRTHDELEGYARECLGIATEMGHAVEALLTLGKLSRGEVALEVADVNIRALADEAWKPIAFHARELGVQLAVDDDAGPVVANRDLLLRALANLIDNAVEYGDAPGTVQVTHRRSEGRSVIEVANALSEVPIGFEEHAFEPFWRGDAARTDAARHAGLGLALVSQIAELHGGRASVSAGDGRVVAQLEIPDV